MTTNVIGDFRRSCVRHRDMPAGHYNCFQCRDATIAAILRRLNFRNHQLDVANVAVTFINELLDADILSCEGTDDGEECGECPACLAWDILTEVQAANEQPE